MEVLCFKKTMLSDNDSLLFHVAKQQNSEVVIKPRTVSGCTNFAANSALCLWQEKDRPKYWYVVCPLLFNLKLLTLK
jgi:hypothetical protein